MAVYGYYLMYMGNLDFPPGQILYLQNRNLRLYCELIEYVVSRDLLWVRPLMLVETQPQEQPPIVTDLQNASDLLWSVKSFQPAVDTEIITYLTQLWNKQSKSVANKTISVNQLLYHFIQDFWSKEHL